MNVLPADGPVDPCLWERPRMRLALATHDISEVYRLLGAAGVSQRRIAALTGQNLIAAAPSPRRCRTRSARPRSHNCRL